MGLFDSLFGGSETTSTTPNTYQLLGLITPEQKELYQKLGIDISKGLSSGVTPYTGEGVAGFTEDQLAGMDRLRALSETDTNPLYTSASDVYSKYMSGQPTTEINSDITNQYYTDSIYKPALKTFRDETLPMLEEELIGTGTFAGTPREERVQRAIRDFGDTQNNLRASVLYQDEQARRELAETAANRALLAAEGGSSLATTLRDNALKDAYTQYQIGEVQQALNQANLSWDYEQFLRTQPESSPYIKYAMDFLGMGNAAGASAVQNAVKSASSGGIQDIFGNILGTMGSGSGVVNTDSWGNIFSGDGEAGDYVSAGMDVIKIAMMFA